MDDLKMRVRKLRLRKGDVLVVQVRRRLSLNEMERIKASWRRIIEDVPSVTMILDDGARVLRLPWLLRWLLRWA